MLVNRSVLKVFLYLRNSATNEVVERWDFEAECEGCDDHDDHDGNGRGGGTTWYAVDDGDRRPAPGARDGIRDVFRQICATASCLPALTRELKYTVTVKLEEPPNTSNTRDAVQTIPRTWFRGKNYGLTPNAQWY